MPRIRIDALDDPRIAVYRDLKRSNATRGSDVFVVEGLKLLERLQSSRFPLTSALATDRQEDRVGPLLSDDTPPYVVPQALVDLLVGFNFHQGVLACGRRLPPPGVEQIVRAGPARQTLLVCPRVDNPENLGSILRLSDVFGVDAVLVGRRCPDPLSRRVLRVSMGSALRVPTIVASDLGVTLDALRRDHGFVPAAAVTDPDALPVGRFRRPDRLALVLGCEGTGLDPEWLRRCEIRLTIPMRPAAESLNLAVAAGIFLHRLMTQEAEESS